MPFMNFVPPVGYETKKDAEDKADKDLSNVPTGAFAAKLAEGGMEEIARDIGEVKTDTTAIRADTASIKTTASTINIKIDNSTYGLNAVKNAVNTAVSNTATNNTASKTGTLSQKESYTIGLLENGTYGLNALGKKAYIKCGGDGWRKDKLNAPEGLAPNASTPAKIVNVGNYIFIFAAANKCYKYNMVDDSFVLLPTPTQGGFYRYNITKNVFENLGLYFSSTGVPITMATLGNNFFLSTTEGIYMYNVLSGKETRIAEDSLYFVSETGNTVTVNNCIYSITNYGLIKNSPIKNFPSMYLKRGNQFYTDADVYNSSYTLISGNTIPADGIYYFVGPDPYISFY